MRRFLVCFVLYCFSLSAQSFTFDFVKDHEGWSGDFTDYPVGAETDYDLAWGWSNAPFRDHDDPAKGMFLSGNNHSDDLFMFIKKQVSGLKPHTTYDVFFSVTIQTNVANGTAGVGGSPGGSVFFKAGASTEEPKRVVHGSDYRLNVDKGEQGHGGLNALVIGNLAHPDVDRKHPVFKPKNMTSGDKFIRITTDAQGKAWVFLGTDSGFEATSTYYITKVDMNFNQVH